MKLLIVLAAIVAIGYGQVVPDEWLHFYKVLVCQTAGFRARNNNDPANSYYQNGILRRCGAGTRFAMEVCTCITDPSQVAQVPQRPFCERLLNVTGTGILSRTNNGHYIRYEGNPTSIFRNLEATCYRGSYFEFPYLESNDYGNSMNIRFGVRFQNIANVVNNQDTIIIMTNGDCGRNQAATLRVGYNPTNDSYIFFADRFFQTCRMLPQRSIANRNLIDTINWRFSDGALSVTVNDQLIGRSGCTVSTPQNIFGAFNYKLARTTCPLRIGNPGGLTADVCLSNLQMNRDCAAGM